MKPFAFSKPPFYQEIQGKRLLPFGKLKPLNTAKLKWPNRLSIVGLLFWVLGLLAGFTDRPEIFVSGLLGFFIFTFPSIYILLRRTSIVLD